MSPNVIAKNLTAELDGAIADICSKLPSMRQMAEAFGALARARRELRIDDAHWPGVREFDAAAFGAGEPLLAGADLSGWRPYFVAAAQRLLPVIEEAFPRIGSSAAGLRSALDTRPVVAEYIVGAALEGDHGALRAISETLNIQEGSLSFLARELLKACLHKAAEGVAHLADDTLWCKGYCPVCGAAPDFGILKEKRDPSDFLISKAGRLWLHCSLCGHIWRFVRLVCPACGMKDHEQLEVLTAEGRERERIHSCLGCRRYLLVVDLVECQDKLNPDLLPLGLTPLDVLAQAKGYTPMARTSWNAFD